MYQHTCIETVHQETYLREIKKRNFSVVQKARIIHCIIWLIVFVVFLYTVFIQFGRLSLKEDLAGKRASFNFSSLLLIIGFTLSTTGMISIVVNVYINQPAIPRIVQS